MKIQLEEGSLAAAAAALEAELSALEALAREAARPSLTSRRAVEQSSARLGALASAEERLAPRLQALTAAFARIGARQQALADAVTARAAEIRDRRATLAALLERYDGLGRGAAEVNALARDAQAALGREDGPPAVLDLVPIADRVAALLDGARALSEASQASGFADLASEAHALEQQLLSMKNRLALVGERARAGLGAAS
ncbi:hypothetical protein [Anaeromyxobacter oryzae]|uniref:Uncharacterized protein n=1 Tax=Anaeromyxobacter oryzae TaxID=2918170 RepID=A0ABN6MWV7_9BACT|nr:hypothetical protein [Anaeromyxobacter oryzae]BDG05442.1 hypothetical protein AMOR_44380 [Anaeromyxobacter oryzae]